MTPWQGFLSLTKERIYIQVWGPDWLESDNLLSNVQRRHTPPSLSLRLLSVPFLHFSIFSISPFIPFSIFHQIDYLSVMICEEKHAV